MKVPDLAEATGSSENSKKPKNVDLGKYRKKKKQSKHLLHLTVILLAVTAFALIWVNADTIFEPFRGIASRIETKTSYDIGFPIELPGSSEYSLMKFGDTFSLLTDTYLYAYDTSGEQLYALKHGYSHPEQTASEKRVLLFDKSAYSFAVYSKASLMYKHELDDKIVSASIGNDGLAAVVTESKRYSNVLYVYDDGGNWKYTKKFADENVMQVCSVGDGEHIIVSTISSAHGDIIANYYRYSIKTTEGHDWKYSLTSNSLPCGMYADKDNVLSVCDNAVISLSQTDGTLNDSTPYNGTLRHFFMNSGNIVLQYNDISANRNVLLIFDENASSAAMANVSASASCVYADKDGVYVLDGARLRIYDSGLITENDISATDAKLWSCSDTTR